MGKTRGFTLIELMVTIAVMAIVASFAIPNFRAVKAKQKIDYSTKELEKTLLQARYDAVLHRQKITLNLGETGNASSQILYWNIPDGQQIEYLEFKCESNHWNAEAVAGVDKLIFSTDGTAQLSRGYTDDEGNAQRTDVALSAIEIAISNGDITNYVEITSLGKITTKKESRQGQECS